jgi:hypothetical protein
MHAGFSGEFRVASSRSPKIRQSPLDRSALGQFMVGFRYSCDEVHSANSIHISSRNCCTIINVMIQQGVARNRGRECFKLFLESARC